MQNPNADYLKKKRNMQMELFIKEADFKKNEQKRVQLEAAVKELKKKKAQIELEMMQKDNELKKHASSQVAFLNEIKKLKKTINDLR